MSQTSVQIKTMDNASLAVGWAGERTLTIDRPLAVGGMGLGYNGGDLLLLAVGACYCNDLFREAALRAVSIKRVHIEVQGEWGGNPVRARQIEILVTVEAENSQSDILELISHTDQLAEVPNSLRFGTPVKLGTVRALSTVGN
ncbi:MAG: oxidoreductase [Chloroflexi bacterium]|nr:oxidoreductase [Chloroflexota bacterium]